MFAKKTPSNLKAPKQRFRGYFPDDTKLRILNDWMGGMKVKDLTKKYKDPVIGKPYMDEIWEILREVLIRRDAKKNE